MERDKEEIGYKLSNLLISRQGHINSILYTITESDIFLMHGLRTFHRNLQLFTIKQTLNGGLKTEFVNW